MKILIITNHSYMLWRFRRELIAALLENSEVLVSTPFVGHEDDLAAMGCRMIETSFDRRSVDPLAEWKLYRFYRSLLRTERPDLVLTYSIKPNVYGGYACRRLHIPYCVNVQGLGSAFQREPAASVAAVLYKTAVRSAGTVFFENRSNAEEFVRRGITSPDKETVLPGAGVNLEHFRAQPYPDESGGIHFLFLGRIMKEKGVDELLEAAEALKRKYGDRAVFDLVGFYEDAYAETVERLADAGVIRFHGFQQEPRPWYAAAHCVVLPSYHEGMSNVLLEGAASGRALITTDVPGCREAAEDGVSGFLCKAKDARSLEECMEKFMALSEDERREMGVNGRKKMEAEFDRAVVVDRTIRCLQTALPPGRDAV